jgi:hippurate hydrolase
MFWFVGGSDPAAYAQAEQVGRVDQDIPSNHSPYFAPVLEPTLSTGVEALVTAAMAWLPPAGTDGVGAAEGAEVGRPPG